MTLAKSIKIMLLFEPELEEGKRELSMFFSASIGYKELILKLTALEILYDELCRLLNVSTSEYPLEIAKMEVGSWWIKIFGESKVIALITGLTEKAVSYFHRNFTQEGKIQAIPKKLEVVEGLLDLSKSLKEYGVDTKVLDENIEHSAVIISNQLNDLLKDQPNVKINNKGHYIGAEYDEKLLEQQNTLLLESGTSEE